MNRLAAVLLGISGFSALTYEVAWVRALGWTFGSTAATVAAVTSTFLLGLALGAAAFGRLGDRVRHPWRLFGTIELGVAGYGLACPILLSALDRTQAHPIGTLLWTTLFVLPPTIGLGASVPILAAAAVRGGGGYGRVSGRLYAWNTLGGLLGVGLAGFWMLETLGVRQTILIAAVGNVVVGVTAWLARPKSQEEHPAESVHSPLEDGSPSRWLGVGIVLAGSLSLGWEVVWTRLLAQFLRNSIYSFAAVLGVMLLGFTLGSACGARLARRGSRALTVTLPAAVSVLGLAGVWLTHALAEWARFPAGVTPRLARLLGLPLDRFGSVALAEASLAAVLVLPPALLLGILYPAFMQRNWRGRFRFGSFYGDVNLLHTLGALAGALLTGFVLLPRLGLTGTSWTVAALGAVASLVFLLDSWRHVGALSRITSLSLIVIGLGVVVLFPEGGVRFWKANERDVELVAYEEDAMASVAVVRDTSGHVSLRLNATGILGGSAGTRIEARQGLLPRLLHERPRNALALGLGAGHSAAALLRSGVPTVDAVEVVPSVLTLLPHFSATNGNLHTRRDVRLILDDGRTYLRRSDETYDLIVGDLFYPWLSEAGYLYTREHFQTVKEHLADSGIFVQWIPMHQLSWEAFGSVARTFVAVFGDSTTAWIAGADLPFPIVALAGRPDAMARSELRALVTGFQQPHVARAAHEQGWASPGDVLANRWADATALRELFADAPLNTADRPLVEYLAARRLESDVETGRRAFVSLSKHWGPPPDTATLGALSEADRLRVLTGRELAIAGGARLSTEPADWQRAVQAVNRGLSIDPSHTLLQAIGSSFGWQLLEARQPSLVLDMIPMQPSMRMILTPSWSLLEAAARLESGEVETALTMLTEYEPSGPRDRFRRLAWLAVAQLLSDQPDAASRSLSEAMGLAGQLPRTALAAQALLRGNRDEAQGLLEGHPSPQTWRSLLE